jgi:hypothetical protein
MTQWVVLKSVRVPRGGELWDKQLVIGDVEADTKAEALALARMRWHGKLSVVSRISFEITEAEYLARGLDPYWLHALPPGSVDALEIRPAAPVTPAPGDEAPPPVLTKEEVRVLKIKQSRREYKARKRAKYEELAERARKAQGRE